ncbi:MAG: hypothetical protein DMG22_00930 [Acidobacteria bacterium]|nr:MAG: hypothetical protein DMG22_00930 [Acidobacteriota bacterium]
MVEAVAMRFLHHDFGFHPRRVGDPADLVRVLPRHARRRRQRHCPGGAARDHRSLHADPLGDLLSCRGLQLLEVNVMFAGLAHGFGDLGGEQRPGQIRVSPFGVDARPDAQPLVDVFLRPRTRGAAFGR